MTSHSLITKAQAQYLKQCKNDLKPGDFVILLDFAQRYTFLIQDEVQSYHWNQQSCTLHPVVIYYLKDETMSEECHCIISDDLIHDTSFVHQTISMTISFIKEQLKLEMKTAHYFSDGCAGQYKNCKYFLNICLRHIDFGANCTWSFFATSHVKSPWMALGAHLKD